MRPFRAINFLILLFYWLAHNVGLTRRRLNCGVPVKNKNKKIRIGPISEVKCRVQKFVFGCRGSNSSSALIPSSSKRKWHKHIEKLWLCLLTISRLRRLDHGDPASQHSGLPDASVPADLTIARTTVRVMAFTFWYSEGRIGPRHPPLRCSVPKPNVNSTVSIQQLRTEGWVGLDG